LKYPKNIINIIFIITYNYIIQLQYYENILIFYVRNKKILGVSKLISLEQYKLITDNQQNSTYVKNYNDLIIIKIIIALPLKNLIEHKKNNKN
jgi:hypothetical protein